MALATGTRLGPYEILSPLGAGGMGEVYRAQDTKLAREVAIKVLPDVFAHDPERLARFQREAQLLASLNHPHIAHIYGLEEAGGVRALVMELVEGEDLAGRIARGRLTLDETLRIARQIAEALEAAHEQGIIHRDLKPANVKLRPDGTVKVLDFGLAKALEPNARRSDISESPTIATPAMTRVGVILGTAAYMSPEQVRGRPLDKRSDVWAFGCVLYELLTGRHAFAGDTPSDSAAKILEREPNWDALPAGVPEPILTLLKRCLRKDPAERLHDIADARLEIVDTLSAPGARVPEPKGLGTTERLLWVALALMATAVALVSWLVAARRGSQPAAVAPVEFGVRFPESYLPAYGVEVSPDGRRIAVGVFGAAGQIWLHTLDSSETKPLPGTEGATRPFWSPDGSSIAFFAGGQLRTIDPTGGPATVVCDAASGGGGTWSADGVILFSSDNKLLRVRASGGTPALLEISQTREVRSLTSPQFLPDNRHFIYFAQRIGGGTVQVASLDSDRPIDLVESEYPAAFAPPSHLLFVRGTKLVAQALDLKNLRLEGAEVPVAPEVTPGFLFGLPHFSATATVLAFARPRGGDAGQLTWFDRAGKALTSIPQPAGVEYLNPAISPDGEHVAVNVMDPQTGNWDIWTLDLVRGIPSRLTSDPAQDTDPIWSPDGKALVFTSNRGGQVGLYRKSVGGSEAEELLITLDDLTSIIPSDWSRDGKFVLYAQRFGTGPRSVWALPLVGDRKPVLVLEGRFLPYAARVSPDGKWVAYNDFSTGTYEVHIRRFMIAGPQRQISLGGGVHPRWTAEGRELVYWAVPRGVTAVDLAFDSSGFRVGMPKPLITTPVLSLIDARSHYDVTRDGRRLLVRQPAGSRGPAMTVILNWLAKVKK